MTEQDHPIPPETPTYPPHCTTPLVFPAGDLDEMIFHEEYRVEHSGR